MLWGHKPKATLDSVVAARSHYNEKVKLIEALGLEPDEKASAEDLARLRFLEVFTEYLRS
jgi:hypothetical protein